MTAPTQGERASLYYKQGSSDKEYHVAIEPSGTGFVVTFAYGRRGSTLQPRAKTAAPIDDAVAKKIVDKLVASTTAKGYSPGAGGAPYQQTASCRPTSPVPKSAPWSRCAICTRQTWAAACTTRYTWASALTLSPRPAPTSQFKFKPVEASEEGDSHTEA